MTIHYLLDHQQESGHFCLLRQGLFFRAYNESALLLHELFGYQIKCKESKSCGQILYYVGFPASVIDRVMELWQHQPNATFSRCLMNRKRPRLSQNWYCALSANWWCTILLRDVASMATGSDGTDCRQTKVCMERTTFQCPTVIWKWTGIVI